MAITKETAIAECVREAGMTLPTGRKWALKMRKIRQYPALNMKILSASSAKADKDLALVKLDQTKGRTLRIAKKKKIDGNR